MGFVNGKTDRAAGDDGRTSSNGELFGLGLGACSLSPGRCHGDNGYLEVVFFTDEGEKYRGRHSGRRRRFILDSFFFLFSQSFQQFDATSPLHYQRVAPAGCQVDVTRSSAIRAGSKGSYRVPWIRLPFIAIYGVAQPVLPATIFHPTKLIWMILGFLRGLGWYLLLPLLILSFMAAAGQISIKRRNLLLWLSLLAWIWILLAALRGGADLWDNPRYRAILFLWQAVLAGYVWVWWREGRNPWLPRVILMEVLFLLVFTQWYASRYYHWVGNVVCSYVALTWKGAPLSALAGGRSKRLSALQQSM